MVQRILEDRRIENPDTFLNPVYHERPDPFLMRDMEKAVGRIMRAIEQTETIAAWTDYDCDGIPAGALLSDFFSMIQYPLRSYIPERREGYGLNVAGIEKLKDEGVSLIITADCGITDTEAVAFANSIGVDVIVTDHHLPQDTLPDAVAVLNPHRTDCEYPFKGLCGTGVAFKLVEALIKKYKEVGHHYISWSEGQEKWLLDLVALATVADMVPLVGENRTLVHFGLVVLRKGRRKGLRALLEKARTPPEHVTEDDIAFSIAPKINAGSRMKSPLLGLELLTTDDTLRADALAKDLWQLNDARKLEGARVSKEVRRRLEGLTLPEVIVMGHSSWNPALLGIAATGVVETYQKTVCLWGMDGELIKGSCRSNGEVNIVSLMTHAGDVFEDFGGHEQSGGFSLKKSAIHQLPETLLESFHAVRIEKNSASPKRRADGTLTISELNEPFYRALRSLAPFGVGNPKPLFEVRGCVEQVAWFGAHKEHARITLSHEEAIIDGIVFFAQRASFCGTLAILSPGDDIVACGSLEQSFFGSKKELRIRLEDVCVA